jgi:magnesium transporter
MSLALHSCDPHWENSNPDLSAESIPPNAVWIDLLNPTEEEIAFVERTAGVHVPARAELVEIETSSRLRTENGVLYLSTSMLFGAAAGEPRMTPLGFVLSKDRLVTVRFDHIVVFETFKQQVGKPDNVHPSAVGAFVGLLEAIIDRFADHLEGVGADLDATSHQIFRADPAKDRTQKPGVDRSLREAIRSLGREGDFISKVRDALLGFGRIVPFVTTRAADWLQPETQARLATLKQDIVSLNDYDAYLNTKVQFLLDATLGLVNIDQNNIIKLLTIVTIVGIGPTLVASWYGMNFKIMPELGWHYGYPYAIVLALVTGIAPLLWFRLRRWL